MAGKTVLVLGGGVGGIVAANALRQRLAAEHRVVLVDKRGEYVFTPSLLWVMVGQRRPEQITKDLRRLARPGVDVTPRRGNWSSPTGSVSRSTSWRPCLRIVRRLCSKALG
jgi:sulfide:quinone oxidoreductase